MKKIKFQEIFLVGLFLTMLPYCYLCFFTNPVSDDFPFSYRFQTEQCLEWLKSYYLNWNGRYVSNIFVHLNPLAFNSFFWYKVVSGLTIVLMFCGNYVFIRELFCKSKVQTQWTVALILNALFFHNMPIISEGVYWFTGASIYTLGVVFTFVYAALLIREIRSRGSFFRRGLLMVLLFLCCGFSEVLTFLIVFFLGTLSFVFYKNQLVRQRLVFVQLLGAIVFSCLLVFSPGNAVRESVYENSHNLSSSLIYSVAQVARFCLVWLCSLPFVVASLFYLSVGKKLRKYVWFDKSFYLNRGEALILLLLIVFICVFPPYWATGMLGQHRTLNVAYAFFLPMWFVLLTVWQNYYKEKISFNYLPKIKRVLAVVFFLALLFTGNGFGALNDLFSGSAKRYDSQLTKRFKMLQGPLQKNQSIFVFEPLKAKPHCLFSSDISDSPKDWKNRAYNLYFRTDSTDIYLK